MTVSVLVIDDNSDIAQSMADLLSLLGYQAYAFTGGFQAIAEAKRLCPHFALIDLGMPEMDGFEVARQLRQVAPEIVLVACTAWGDSQTRARTAAAGFARHLQKPLDVQEVDALLQHYSPGA